MTDAASTTAAKDAAAAHDADKAAADATAKDAAARKATDTAANRQAKARTVYEAVAFAHDNQIKELDAVIAQLGQGNPVTVQQLAALKAAATGMSQALAALPK